MAAKRRPKPPQYDPRIQRAIQYPRNVVARKVIAGRWVRLACERFLRDYDAAEAGRGPWVFDAVSALKPIHLAGELQNVKGPEAGEPIKLLDFQFWLIANIYGFLDRGTRLRRFRQASVWVPKGNGKTSIAAVLALYSTFLEGEGGAEGYSAAVSRDQARLVFDLAKIMAER